MEKKCQECGETRIIQNDASDLGYDFVVFGCYSQYHVYPNYMTLVSQGNSCKDRVISTLRNHNQLTSAETERLGWLSEELGEVQQVIGKILRHGYESRWPPLTGPSNRENLHKEIRDVLLVLNLMHQNEDINYDEILIEVKNKHYKNCYLHHQEL